MVEDIKKVLCNGREALLNAGISEREARLLLAHTLNISKEELLIKKECKSEEAKLFYNLINRRISGEPYAYVIGYKEFMGLKFIVNRNVLIPREDTEILVQTVISGINDRKNILDMCTGNGCIAISLSHYINDLNIVAVDISSEALEIAIQNAAAHKAKIKFIKSDLFNNIKEYKNKFDIIVSNPPYIKSDDIYNLQTEVKNEPIIALDGGKSGLEMYENIISEAYKYLANNGLVFFEIGYNQAKDVEKILIDNNYIDIEVIKDLSGNDRIIKAKLS